MTQDADRQAFEAWMTKTFLLRPNPEGYVETQNVQLMRQAWQAALDYARGANRDLVAILNKDSRRDIYACQGGGYAISYGGGFVSYEAISKALNAGLIQEKWPGKNLECWILA